MVKHWKKIINKHLGVLVNEHRNSVSSDLPFADGPFLRSICREGHNIGICAYVFLPSGIDLEQRRVRGYSCNQQGWHSKMYPLPDLIYDRSFCRTPRQIQSKRKILRELTESTHCRLLGSSLKDKWTVYQVLHKHPVLSPHIPATIRLQSREILADWLKQYAAVVMKPLSGSKGMGLFKLSSNRKCQQVLEIEGKHRQQRIRLQFSCIGDLWKCLQPIIGRRKYLIQPLLSLNSRKHAPYDLRVLMQKDGSGNWQQTGSMIRLGPEEGFISNIAGGGIPLQAKSFLEHQFNAKTCSEILSCIDKLSRMIAPYLEQFFGRLVELGIDFGIDEHAHIWILEVNSRPGRNAFIREENIHKQSIKRPISYAKYLLDRP